MPRASATMSAWPEAMIASACLASVITYRDGRHANLFPEPFGKWHLVSRSQRNLLQRRQATAGDIDKIAAARAFKAAAKAVVCAGFQPPSTQSVADTRTPTGRPAGKAAHAGAGRSNNPTPPAAIAPDRPRPAQ